MGKLFVHRASVLIAFCVALSAWMGVAAAAAATPPGNKRDCASARQSALEQIQSSHLRAARESFGSCSKRACSAALRRECMLGFNQLDAVDIPSIVPIVTDSAGAPVTDIQVTMDGEILATRLDGQPVAVDPGVHEFSFAHEGQIIATQRVMIVQGQQSRPLSVSLQSSVAAPSGPVEKPAPVVVAEPSPAPSAPNGALVPLAIGAAGVACAESVTLAILLGKDETLGTAADAAIGISIGIGAAALVTTAWAFLRSRHAAETPSSQSALRLSVRPSPAGAVAGVSGSF